VGPLLVLVSDRPPSMLKNTSPYERLLTENLYISFISGVQAPQHIHPEFWNRVIEATVARQVWETTSQGIVRTRVLLEFLLSLTKTIYTVQRMEIH